MSIYNPDAWCIVKITYKGKIHYRVFAGWYGGFAGTDSWKMNSGIVDVIVDGELYEFIGSSGSIYRCHKDCERMTGYMSSIYQSFLTDNNEDQNIECIDFKDMKL